MIISADPGLPHDLFAVQIENVMDNCIVTAFWRHPVDLVDENLIRNYTIFANGTNVSNDTIISGASNDNMIFSTVLSVPGCYVHYISVRAINVCGRPGPKSSTVMLDPGNRHNIIVPDGTPCNADSGSKTNAGIHLSFLLFFFFSFSSEGFKL